MIEHYGLSEAQKGYLNGSKRLSNESKERKAILRKAFQSWSVLKPILDSTVVSNDFKYLPFFNATPSSEFDRLDIPKDRFTFEKFLNSLLRTSRENPTSKEIEKMRIAKEILEQAILYYQTRFSNNQLVYDKFAEFTGFIQMLQSVYEQELDNIVKADFVRIRKGLIFPPYISQDEYWHSYCNVCYSYSTNNKAKTKDDAINEAIGIKHSDYCPFLKEFVRVEDQYDLIINCIHFIEPLTE